MLSNEAYLSGGAFLKATPALAAIPPLGTTVSPIASYAHDEKRPTPTMPPNVSVGLMRSTFIPPRNVPSTKGNVTAPNYFHTPTVVAQSQIVIPFSGRQSASETQDQEDI